MNAAVQVRQAAGGSQGTAGKERGHVAQTHRPPRAAACPAPRPPARRDYSKLLESKGERPLSVKRCETVEEVLRTADVVSLHCNLDNNTRHLMNKERLVSSGCVAGERKGRPSARAGCTGSWRRPALGQPWLQAARLCTVAARALPLCGWPAGDDEAGRRAGERRARPLHRRGSAGGAPQGQPQLPRRCVRRTVAGAGERGRACPAAGRPAHPLAGQRSLPCAPPTPTPHPPPPTTTQHHQAWMCLRTSRP